MIGVLGGFEDAGAICVVPERRDEHTQGVGIGVRLVEGNCRSGCADGDPRDGAGVGAVAGKSGRCARRGQVGSAGVAVVAGDACRECGRCVVVEDQRLAGVLREVDDHVGSLGGGQQQRVLIDVADIEAGRVGDPRGLVGRHDHGSREEPAFRADLNPVRPLGADGGIRRREHDRVGLRGGDFRRLESDLAECARGGVGDVPRQVPEAVVDTIQDAVAIRLRIHGGVRVDLAVDDGGVVERFHAHRHVRCRRDQGRLAELVASVREDDVRITVGLEIRVGDRRVLHVLGRWPEPGAVHPATDGAHPGRIAPVLGGM